MKLNIRGIDTPADNELPTISSTKEIQRSRRLLDSSSALNEFRWALDTWFPDMDAKTRIEAVQMAEDWRPPSPKKRIAE